ncbi:MAG: hypothetical protein WCV62_05730 [Candidatus Peribacteraceae bacterium]|jgi:hypothetical protein
MSYLVSNLVQDLLPRVGRLPQQSGITLFRAATSVQSLVFKRLLDRKSDLLATGNLFLVIPEYDYMAPLPSDFLSMAEKPSAIGATSWLGTTPWMAGTVTSYDTATKTLVMSVTSINGSGTLASWHVAVGVTPGQPIYTLDTSASSVLVGLGSKTFVTATELSLAVGQNIIISSVELPTDTTYRSRLDPNPLDEDDRDDLMWWEKYRIYGETFETAAITPRKYKVLGTNLYVRPKVSDSCMVTGRYNAKPSDLTLVTQTIPWNGMFDEVFREGVVWILTKGVSMPGVDPAFAAFVKHEVDTILDSRARILPSTHRIKRGAYL